MFELRPFQKESIAALEAGNHVICVAPTGSGKSFIFETMAKKGGKVLLVSPLIALSRQHAANLMRNGVKVSLLSGTSEAESPSGSGVWIVSPENLFAPVETNRYRHLKNWKPDLLVVDECHCFWEWGRDFRPAFRLIPKLIREFSIPASLWLTATLPYVARDDLRKELPFPVREIGKFEFPSNLELFVRKTQWSERMETFFRWLRDQNSPGVVFVNTRAWTTRLLRIVKSAGKNGVVYHAGLSREERRSVEAQVTQNRVDVVIATSAFGMGMDFPHLNWVCLWQAPLNLLSLAQAIGRVGRAGRRGFALLFWDEIDFKNAEWSLRGDPARTEDFRDLLRFLSEAGCRREKLTEYFEGNTEGQNSTSCDRVDSCDQCCI